MARQPFQGLFQGPSVGDVMSLRNKERDTRIRQAFADSAGAGGGCCFIMLESRYGDGTMDKVVRS